MSSVTRRKDFIKQNQSLYEKTNEALQCALKEATKIKSRVWHGMGATILLLPQDTLRCS
jgi:hypothetical protein